MGAQIKSQSPSLVIGGEYMMSLRPAWAILSEKKRKEKKKHSPKSGNWVVFP